MTGTAVPGQMPPTGITAAQRMEHAWQRGLQGAALGAMAGPFGLGGGLLLGLIMGAVTADNYYQDLQTQAQGQMQTEQKKDAELEAQLDKEMARQRALEGQLNSAGVTQGSQTSAGASAGVHSHGKGSSSYPTAVAQNSVPASYPQAPVASQATAPPIPRQVAQSRSGFKNVEVKDMNSDGVPDVWIYYDPQNPKQIVRREEDTDNNGKVDTWSYFSKGQLVRRQVDRNGDGIVDASFFYKDDKLVREERDETGNGVVTYRALYQDGRLAKVEKDTDHDGRMDSWSYYDPKTDGEVLVKEERDFNGDGQVDLWSYYEGGRLVERDVSEVGMKYLSGKERAANAPARAALPSSLPQS
jgi:antitoxin component YwqK of YwqJK toxin-antitoxin module